jgi:hypothetical protein
VYLVLHRQERSKRAPCSPPSAISMYLYCALCVRIHWLKEWVLSMFSTWVPSGWKEKGEKSNPSIILKWEQEYWLKISKRTLPVETRSTMVPLSVPSCHPLSPLLH